MAFSAAF